MFVRIFVLVCCCLYLADSRSLALLDRIRRHAADFKISQYRACALYPGSFKDCGNIGYGLVDIIRSGRKRQADMSPIQLILDRGDIKDQLQDVEENESYLK